MITFHFGREIFLWYWLFKEKEGYRQGKIISGIKTSLKMIRKRRERESPFPKEDKMLCAFYPMYFYHFKIVIFVISLGK